MSLKTAVQIGAGVLLVLTTSGLAYFLLDTEKNSPLAYLVLGSFIVAGFIAGARARKPVQQAALVGPLAYLLMSIAEVFMPGSEYYDPGGLAAVAICGMCLVTGFGGLVAAALLPHRENEGEKDTSVS